METTKLAYGGDMMLFVGGSTDKLPIAFSTSAKMEVKLSTRDISSKDSGYWKEKLGGRLEWSASTDALYTEALVTSTGISSYDELYTLMIARTPINLVFAATSGTAPIWTVD